MGQVPSAAVDGEDRGVLLQSVEGGQDSGYCKQGQLRAAACPGQ